MVDSDSFVACTWRPGTKELLQDLVCEHFEAGLVVSQGRFGTPTRCLEGNPLKT